MGDFRSHHVHGKIKVHGRFGSESNSAVVLPSAISIPESRKDSKAIALPEHNPDESEIFNFLEDLPTTNIMAPLTSTNHYSQPSPAAGTSRSTTPKNARKRESDRAYRERQKKGKVEMSCKLVTLTEENNRLDAENRDLKLRHKDMNEVLQSQSEEIEKLKSDNERLKSDYQNQHGLVQTLSALLANAPDLQLENRRLEIENGLLKQLENVSDKMAALMQESARLQIENRILRVQNSALCGRMISDSDSELPS